MKRQRVYAGIVAASAIAGFVVAAFLVQKASPAQPGPVDENTPAEKRFPEQWAAWRRPAREDARWRELRGHAFSLKERDETERDDDPRWRRVFAGLSKARPQPAGCAECHASVADARQSIGCADCHEPRTFELRITRADFLPGLDFKSRPSQQQMRSFVCAQCHSEYFLRGDAVTRPWGKGLNAEDMEAWYDEAGICEWTHGETGAALIRVRHPQFEMWRKGMHARNGVACADCHMGPVRRGAASISDHHIALGRLAQACLRCHPGVSEGEMSARVSELRARYAALEGRALDAMTGLLDEVYAARERGATEAEIEPARRFQRRAMLRVGLAADGSRGLHAPSETARLLAEAIDFARRGQVAAAGLVRR